MSPESGYNEESMGESMRNSSFWIKLRKRNAGVHGDSHPKPLLMRL